MHSNALAAAKAARCAAAQNRYWEMRAALFDDPAHLAEADTLEDARKLGLDMKAYEACLRDEASTASVKSEAAEAEKLGINGTPAFVIGRTGGDEMDGAVVLGAQPLPAFEAQIGELVSKKEILPKVDAGSQ
jgi:protein-disulfide isomerase